MRTVQTITEFHDDLDPGTEATVQLAIGLNGQWKTLQVGPDNHQTFSEVFGPWWNAAASQAAAQGAPDVRQWIASGQSPFPADSLAARRSDSGKRWTPRPTKDMIKAHAAYLEGLHDTGVPELPVAGLAEEEAIGEPTDRADLSLVPQATTPDTTTAEDPAGEDTGTDADAEDRSTYLSPELREPKDARERQKIRDWAQRQTARKFRSIAARGRIPRWVVTAYYRDNPAA